MIPACAEGFSHFLPAQALCPTRQNLGIRLGQSVLSDGLGYLFYPYSAVRTLNPAGFIDKKHLVTPHRDELETPYRQRFVTGPFASVVATPQPTVGARLHLHFQRRHQSAFYPVNVSVNKRFEFLDLIEDSLNLHPVSFSQSLWGVRSSIFSASGQDALPSIFQNHYPSYGQFAIFLPTKFPEERKKNICASICWSDPA